MSEFLNHRYTPRHFPELGLLEDATPEEMFVLLDGEEYIRAHRMPKYGPANFIESASQCDVNIVPHTSFTYGTYYAEQRAISVNRDRPQGRIQHTFGHEIGHVFLGDTFESERDAVGYDSRVEAFCDYFGYQFAFYGINLETLDIENIEEIAELAIKSDTDLTTVVEAWLVLSDRPNITVTSKVPATYGSDGGKLRTNSLCRCALVASLPCPEVDTPINVDLSDFELWGLLPSTNHRELAQRYRP